MTSFDGIFFLPSLSGCFIKEVYTVPVKSHDVCLLTGTVNAHMQPQENLMTRFQIVVQKKNVL